MNHLLIISLLLTFACRLGASDDTLTAAELAHHLGIESWVSKARLQGADYDLEVLHVQNGKAVRSVLSASVFATDRELTRISIQASQSPDGMKLTIQSEAGARVTKRGEASIPLVAVAPLPTIIAPGDYVLGGEIPEARLGPDQPPLRIEDIKDGLLLRVTKRANR